MVQKLCLKLSTSVCRTNIRHSDLWLTRLKWQKIEMLGMLEVKNLKILSSEEANEPLLGENVALFRTSKISLRLMGRFEALDP